MKRLMKSLVALIIILSMSMTALAVESPSDGYVVSGVVDGSVVDKNGNSVKVKVQDVLKEVLEVIGYIVDQVSLQSALGPTYQEGMEVVEIREIAHEGDAELIEWPLSVTFDVPGVEANSVVKLLQYIDGEWVEIEVVAGAGTITGTFHSLGEVAFVFMDEVSSESTGTGSADKDTSESPKTGETNAAVMAVVIASIAVATAVTFRKEQEEA